MIDRPLQTFSVAFEQRAFSELEYARQVARAIGADAHEVVIDDNDFFGALPRLVWHEDEPIAHPSSVPLFFVSRLASEHVKVVLTGEGSDELLGRLRQVPARAAELAGRGALADRAGAAAPVRRRITSSHGCRRRVARYATRSFLAMPHTPEAIFFDNFAAIGTAPPAVAARLTAGALRHTGLSLRARRARISTRRPKARGTLDRLLYTDIKTYLVELLMKQDQMSMAASIESRVPFLDHHLVEFATTLAPRMKLRGLTTKWILRQAVKGLLPREILTRPKMGFPVPFSLWMRGPWAHVARDVLFDRRSRERGLVNHRALAQLMQAHAAGTAVGR